MSSDSNMSEMPVHQDAPPAQADYIYEGGSSDDGPQAAPGMGQSKSSRRRRRKRKNKVAGAPQPGQNSVGDSGADGQSVEVQAAAAPTPTPRPQPQQQQQSHYQNNNQQPSGGKRWKKKFRDRQRQALPPGVDPNNAFQPGNTASGFGNGGGGGFKRKNKQRRDRSFVGPMDHSYRATNGNFADAPPSTIEIHGNHHGGRGNGGGQRYTSDSQPIDYSQGRPVPIAEDAPTKIYFFIEDLFFLAKIQETARKLGVKVAFIKNDKEKDIVAELNEMDDDNRPALIVFDLNNANAKPLTLIPKLKSKLKKGTSIIGFLQHVQGELKAKAIEAGCDTVMPRSAFSQNLPNLLRRYSSDEEDDQNFNQ